MVNFNPIDKGYMYFVRWQSHQVNTKESILSVCDKSYEQRKTTERAADWNFAQLCFKYNNSRNDLNTISAEMFWKQYQQNLFQFNISTSELISITAELI